MSSSGSLKWTSPALKLVDTFSAPAIGADSVVYIGGDCRVHALAPDSGSVIWKYDVCIKSLQGALSPSIAPDGSLYVVVNSDEDTSLFAFSK